MLSYLILMFAIIALCDAKTYCGDHTKVPATTPKPDVTLAPSSTAAPTPKGTNAETPKPTSTNSTSEEKCLSYRNRYWSDNECKTCKQPSKVFAIFFETQKMALCDKFLNSEASKYVTHIYWSFAIFDKTGAVSSKFQGSDTAIMECIKKIRRKRCIKHLPSIGGAAIRKTFLELNTDEKIATFGKTTAALVKKFNFDGIDIDDESGHGDTSTGDWTAQSANVVKYLKAVRSEISKIPKKDGEPILELTWDEFPKSADPKHCSKKGTHWNRCFTKEIADLIDWVNIMVYNMDSPKNYDNILEADIPNYYSKIIKPSKITIGGCAGVAGDFGACGYGASPTESQMKRYASLGSSKYGGAMIWTGNTDLEKYGAKSMLAMGKAGSYGVPSP